MLRRISPWIVVVALATSASAEVEDKTEFGDVVEVTSVDGAKHKIPHPESPATVLLFLSSDCPIANKYAPEIRRIQAQFEKQGVKFLRVYGDGYHEAEDLHEHTKVYEYTMPAILDSEQMIVVRCGATVTPEAVVLDAEGTIAYRGRIDDRHVDFGRYRQHASEHNLIDALTAVLSGEAPDTPRTKAIGCFLTQLKKSDTEEE